MTSGQSAAALMEEGRRLYRARKYQAAASAFAQAKTSHALAEDSLGEADAANNLSVSLLMAGDPQGAVEAAEKLPGFYRSQGLVDKEGLTWGNLAAARQKLGDKPLALEAYQMANDCLRQAGNDPQRAIVLRKISALQFQMGERLQAVASLDAAFSLEKDPSLPGRVLRALFRLPFHILNRNRDT